MKHDDKIRILGITGGVGSGKSAVMDILEKDYGAKIILADLVSHELMEPGMAVYEEILAAFGPEITGKSSDAGPETPGPPIDRAKLGQIVFSNPEKLALLNRITHTGVADEIRKRIRSYISGRPRSDARLLIAVEAALLIGSGLEPDLDSLWYIYVNEEERIRRLMAGRGYSREYAKSIANRQLSDHDFRENCDVIIDNSGDLSETRKQIDRILADSF